SCPMWQNEGLRYNCVFVVTDTDAGGMCGMNVAHVLCFFSFNYWGTTYPCAVIRWFDRVGDGPDKDTGMWIVRPSFNMRNLPNITIVHVDSIYPAAHLIPVYGEALIPPEIKPHHCYDIFRTFYVNKFVDHHAFEITV
ncbi:hypothetical protein PAXRUDRAFT_155864, partial [Paxillus rubicundulus Ve08.2h10]